MEKSMLVEQIMDFYHEGMPFCDREELSDSLLEEYASHAAFLRREVPWCSELPWDVFLENVAAYRINNERIEACRRFFYDLVKERICGLSLEAAIMELNMWCCENATYHQADSRTANAMCVYKSGFGRCGEESVFAVTVLRSAGIAARQVYAPLWSHCDDNHAWVEVWCDGRWQYLGACEPEAVLNKGWFDIPASRAMLIHARSFGAVRSGNVISREGCAVFINATEHYAKTAEVSLTILDEKGNRLRHQEIVFGVLNYGQYGPIAKMHTDGEGICVIMLGLGDVLLEAVVEGCYQFVKISIDQTGSREVRLEEPKTDIWTEYEFAAPAPGKLHQKAVTEEMEQECADRIAAAKGLREQRLASCYDTDRAGRHPAAADFLRRAGGNFEELYRFIDRDENPDRMKMLAVLAEKDLYDLRADDLEEHLTYALEHRGKYPAEIYEQYLLNPRVEQEELSAYRAAILAGLSEEQKEKLRRSPELIWEEYASRISVSTDEDYKTLRSVPAVAFATGKGNPQSGKILFVAICRSLGIPARINPVNQEAEYYSGQSFRRAAEENRNGLPTGTLTFLFEDNTEWKYHTTWSVSYWKQGMWEALELEDTPVLDGKLQLTADAGRYRVISVYRMGNAGQLVRESFFTLTEGGNSVIQLKKHSMAGKEGTQEIKLPEIRVREDGKEILLSEERKGIRHIVIWLEEGKEPSEHILNEMLENVEAVKKQLTRICVVANGEPKENGTLTKVINATGGLRPVFMDNWETVEETAALMGQTKGNYPLAVVYNEEGKGIFAVSGYHVGSVQLLLQRL